MNSKNIVELIKNKSEYFKKNNKKFFDDLDKCMKFLKQATFEVELLYMYSLFPYNMRIEKEVFLYIESKLKTDNKSESFDYCKFLYYEYGVALAKENSLETIANCIDNCKDNEFEKNIIILNGFNREYPLDFKTILYLCKNNKNNELFVKRSIEIYYNCPNRVKEEKEIIILLNLVDNEYVRENWHKFVGDNTISEQFCSYLIFRGLKADEVKYYVEGYYEKKKKRLKQKKKQLELEIEKLESEL